MSLCQNPEESKEERDNICCQFSSALRWKQAGGFIAPQHRQPCAEGMLHHVDVNTEQAYTATDSHFAHVGCVLGLTLVWVICPLCRHTNLSHPVWCVIWKTHSVLASVSAQSLWIHLNIALHRWSQQNYADSIWFMIHGENMKMQAEIIGHIWVTVSNISKMKPL